MHPIIKILLGVIFIVGSVAAVIGYPQLGLLPAFITVVKGVVPAFLFFIGIFIVWLELDELRIERELAREEKKHKKK